MKKSFISFLCAISVFISCTVTSFAASSIDQVDYHYPPEQISCYYFFKSLGLSDHAVYRLSGSYVNPEYGTSTYQPIRDYYNVLTNSGTSSLGKYHTIPNSTTLHIRYITNNANTSITLGSTGVGCTIIDHSTSCNGYYIKDYTIKSDSYTNSPKFYSQVSASSWVLPDTYTSSETDNSLQAIINLLTINNTLESTNNDLLDDLKELVSLSNTELHAIYNQLFFIDATLYEIQSWLTHNDPGINNSSTSTNESLVNSIDSYESIESIYLNDLSTNLPTVASGQVMTMAPWNTYVYTFISNSLKSIYNSDTQIKAFTDTVLILGFALVMIGVFL